MHLLKMLSADEFHPPSWKPSVDVYRTRKGWLLKFELAGVRLDDVRLNIAEHAVRVTGIRRDWVCGESCRHHTMEIAYSGFERSVELPCNLLDARISSQMAEGMLLIQIETS